MQKFILFLIGLTLSWSSAAQITVTNSTFPVLGDTLFYAFDEQPSISFTPTPGGMQTWDFSDLQPSTFWEQVFEHPGNVDTAGDFSSADLYFQAGDAIGTFLRVDDSAMEIIGFAGADPVGLGFDLATKFDPPITDRRAPMDFFNINELATGLTLGFDASEIPDTLLDLLPITPDSLRVRIAIDRLDVVDGWGDLTMPDGNTYEVLREKRSETRETRIDAKVPIFGWQDVTDLVLQFIDVEGIGQDTSITYQFFNDESKEVIAQVWMNNDETALERVQFKAKDLSTDVDDLGVLNVGIKVFPNPASENISIISEELEAGNYTLTIFNVLGVPVKEIQYALPYGELNELINLSGWVSGNYWYRLVDRQSGAQLSGQFSKID